MQVGYRYKKTKQKRLDMFRDHMVSLLVLQLLDLILKPLQIDDSLRSTAWDRFHGQVSIEEPSILKRSKDPRVKS
jgi:hypothetical protein